MPEPTEAALKPATIHPFAAIAGNWTGGGTIDLTGDIHEKLRCRASYTHGKSNNSLVLAIRCASDNYKFELTSNVVERGGQISGQWNETAYKVSGSISGRVNGNRITAMAKGDSFNAAITVNTTRQQAVGHHHAAGDLHHQRADRDGPGRRRRRQRQRSADATGRPESRQSRA